MQPLTPPNTKISYQAATKEHLQRKPNPLGYTPFEYWKGPKPVIPGSKQPHRPNNTGRTTTIAVTSLHASSDPTAQQNSTVVASGFPAEKQGRLGEKASLDYTNMGWDTPEHGGRAAGPASFQVRDANGNVELLSGQPPSYANAQLPPRDMKGEPSRWNPRYWRKRTWAGVALAVIVAIVVGVVAGVLVAKANRYPDYTKLTYTLEETYSGTDFFDNFDYFEGYDPSGGFVHYVPQARAEQLNLTYASSSSAVLKVDTSVGNTSSPDASTGRFSVRVTSKTQYDRGLFIFDVKHTPLGCGTWPALWLSDPSNWPDNGEIDVMETVNVVGTTDNQMTLHTDSGCAMDVKRKMTGTSIQADCNNATNSNAGCGVAGASSSYGADFNAGGGGVMAVEWRDEGIRMWQFARAGIPADITGGSPDPSSWGTAAADFPNTDCSVSGHFKNQSIIANIDLCGSWAGNVYADSGCPSDCTTYVANYPQAFTNAYWEFGAFQVYKSS
ncbi:uncharacterized protein JN550_008682 [Neoarthrinium moseri]|uniref:uncharacterized protein n=1 Tax=Neoarthrinium moseri TaxID=1658444 RepID=UPI001FDD8937|nr:uncharacterized protein JN550_008682 [Neoarthrinium moseri]KAI1864862.1 hypothetical protein JN550_008682 [Neoarthrinium moseri]